VDSDLIPLHLEDLDRISKQLRRIQGLVLEHLDQMWELRNRDLQRFLVILVLEVRLNIQEAYLEPLILLHYLDVHQHITILDIIQ